MGLSAEEWKFINTFAPWLSAFGTLLAVVVSLYISHSTRRIKLQVSSNIYQFMENDKNIEYLGILVTNIGYRTVFINNSTCMSFEIGRFKKRNIAIGTMYIDNTKTTQFPCRLGENETAKLFATLENNGINWLHNFKKEYLKDEKLKTLRIVIYPNVGKPFKVKPNRVILGELEK